MRRFAPPPMAIRHTSLLICCLMLTCASLAACGPSQADLLAVDYSPSPGNDWEISTPESQGVDPLLVAELYFNAARMETLYSLIVIKNGYLIAEGYFNGGTADTVYNLQSVTKSYTSALVGIALNQGCIASLDQPMLEYFPEYSDQVDDPRKAEITIRQLLQMRGGYPNEESHPALWEALLSGDYLRLVRDFPLVNDPGTGFNYSGLSSHWLGVIVARACNMDLKSFAQEHLFTPLGAQLGEEWIQDQDGYYIGLAGMFVSSRDMAKFGFLFISEGEIAGTQIITAEYVNESLQTYTSNAGSFGMGQYFTDIGYGYQWWSAAVGEHRFNYALGHGGQHIVLLDELNMVIVATADPFWQQHDAESWKHERAVNNLLTKFIASLPVE